MKPNLTMKLSLLIFLLHVFSVRANDDVSGPDVRSLGLGNVHALSQEMVNPAYLSFYSGAQAGVTVINRFGIKELNVYRISGMIPGPFVDMGVKIASENLGDYNRIRCSAGFSKMIFKGFGIGANLHYDFRSLNGGLDNSNDLTFDIGCRYALTNQVNLALLGKQVATIRSATRFMLYSGVSYEMIPSFVLLLEAGADFNDLFFITGGLEVEFSDSLFFRAGIQSHLRSPAIGASYQFQQIKVDVSFSLHQVLGKSSAVCLTYCF